MTVKSKANKHVEKEGTYPKLMISSETSNIYYMTEYGCGIRVIAMRGQSLFHKSSCLAMENFTDFNGEVILSNE